MQSTKLGWLVLRLLLLLSCAVGNLSQLDTDYDHEYEELSGDGLGFPNFIPNCDKLRIRNKKHDKRKNISRPFIIFF